MTRTAVALLAALVVAGCDSTAQADSWTGAYRLPATADPVAISVELAGPTAIVALGPGHLGRTAVKASVHGARVRFTVPGGITFVGERHGRALKGAVTQGALRGTFKLTPGTSPGRTALGLYRAADGTAISLVQAAGFPLWLVELPSGGIHGANAALTTVGGTPGSTTGAGTLAVTPRRIAWTHDGTTVAYDRVVLHQREVRIGRTAATLTLPDGPGPFPAVAMVHGSGPQARDEFQTFAALCELLGIAVLADDKRGIGQSQGTYPGEGASVPAVNVLARDAETEVRYLAALPQIDAKRVGLMGDSQAGWIIALAAAREPAVRWALAFAGPTVSVDETNFFGTLAGKSEAAPSGPLDRILAEVRAQGPGGFDPTPYLRKLTIPVFWVFADDDRNVPTTLCIERLEQLRAGHDFTWTVIHATHSLLDLPSGLNADIPRSRGFGVGMFDRVNAWLQSRSLTG